MRDLTDPSVRESFILEVLDRSIQPNAFDALTYAYRPEPRHVELSSTAIVLDSSAFLRVGQYADVIDYLHTRHSGPVILPGQSIQEFWNNHLNVAESIASGIQRRFDELSREISKVDDKFQDFSARFSILLQEFRESFGYAYDGSTVRRTMSLFDALRRKALVSYVRRSPFLEIATHRKKTKTPPGFKDDGDGDFFVWLDMLDALLIARSRSIGFKQVVLVSNDKKLDWSREGIAHPILSAEVASLLDVPFETWDVLRLVQKVAATSE